ncbi:MAG: hypothetical protein R3F43_11145 [bacterium]
MDKGSIAIDGVSLTVNAVDADRFSVVLIPHTQGVVHLHRGGGGPGEPGGGSRLASMWNA